MTELNQVYKCSICGNIIQVLHPSYGQLVCCNKPMQLLNPKSQKDEGLEKHVPVVEKTDCGIKVKVGSVEHPMEKAHFIEWIEVIADGQAYRKHLNPGDKPEAEFCLSTDNFQVREYCNVHGLWQA